MKKVLFLGAHTDDIELACGGTLHKLSSTCKLTYYSFSLCRDIARNKEISKDQMDVRGYLRNLNVEVIMDAFDNRRFFLQKEEIREALEVQRNVKYDYVFTHWLEDTHQDHQVIAEETVRVFKDTNVVMYPVANSCPTFCSNYYVRLSEREVMDKIHLVGLYQTQKGLIYTDPELIAAQARVEGSKIRTKLAEGFYLYRGLNDL